MDDAPDAAAPDEPIVRVARAGPAVPVAPADPPFEQSVDAPSVDGQIEGLAPGMTIVRRVRRPPRWPGILACLLAVLMLVATGAGIQVAATGDYANSTALAYTAIGLSVAAILFGLIAIVRRWARAAGVVGVVVAVLGNPLVLLYVLGSLSGL